MTLLQSFIQRRQSSAQLTAMQFKEHERWRRYTWEELYNLVEATAAGLSSLGVRKGDRVAIMANTRPEWMITDLATLGLGAITVPIYPNNTLDDVQFILNDSQTKVFVLENDAQLTKWQAIKSQCKSVEHVFFFNSKSLNPKENEPQNWLELLRLGRTHLKQNPQVFTESAQAITLEDSASILYTSGTTGQPKGVLLTHTQVMSELTDVFRVIPVNTDDMTLTFLPFSHVFGRIEAWGSIYAGYTLCFAESIEKIKTNLQEAQPTFMIAVPRIFEKLYTAIQTQTQNQPLKKKLFNRAVAVGREVSRILRDKGDVPPILLSEYSVYRRFLFDKVLSKLGGRFRFAVSGGAPLNPEVAEFFHAIGLSIFEGYGLTETTAGITFNDPLHYKLGTVGRALGDVELKIAEDGEILVRSKKVMKEYYKRPDLTSEVMTEDGFFKTGDIGEIDSDGFLKITDRKKDLIKTAGGKYVAPQRLEGLLKTHPFISNVLIHGDQKKYIVALITLNEAEVRAWAKERGIPNDDFKALSQSPEVYSVIRDAVASTNDHLASFESIKKFAILPADFTIETGELTPSLKVKRRFCDKKFAKEIDALYGVE